MKPTGIDQSRSSSADRRKPETGRLRGCWRETSDPGSAGFLMGHILIVADTPSGIRPSRCRVASDVVIENFRPGVLRRIGLGYDAMQQRASHLVYCSISGYGQSGPVAEKGAFDVHVGTILPTTLEDLRRVCCVNGATHLAIYL